MTAFARDISHSFLIKCFFSISSKKPDMHMHLRKISAHTCIKHSGTMRIYQPGYSLMGEICLTATASWKLVFCTFTQHTAYADAPVICSIISADYGRQHFFW
jgi:hypothetical protein